MLALRMERLFGRRPASMAWLAAAWLWPARTWRNRMAAVHLEEAPDYLLRDIGITRREIRDIRRAGRPNPGARGNWL